MMMSTMRKMISVAISHFIATYLSADTLPIRLVRLVKEYRKGHKKQDVYRIEDVYYLPYRFDRETSAIFRVPGIAAK